METYLLKDESDEEIARFELSNDSDYYWVEGTVKTPVEWDLEGNPTEYDYFAKIIIRFDGCSHWYFNGEDFVKDDEPDSYYHLCGFADMVKFQTVMAFAWKVARDFMIEKSLPLNRSLSCPDEFPEDELNEMLKGYSVKKI